MSLLSVWSSGIGRVRRAPAVLMMLWLLAVAVTIPPALGLHVAIVTHLGASLEAETAADGMNFDWMQEFRQQAGPLGRTLRPDVIGFGAVLDNASALADVTPRAMVVVVCGLVFVALLWFLTPGLIHRLAADRPLHARGFLATCGAFTSRILRLGIVSVVVYGVVFGAFHQWLFDDMFERVTSEISVERTAFAVRLACYLAFFLLVGGVNLLLDFTKVRLVVEDRHSIVAAMAAAARFIGNNRRLAVGAYALNVATFGLVLAAYAALAPGVGTAGWSMWLGFAISQIYVAARLAVKLAFWGSEIAALQTRLAYEGFVRTRSGRDGT